MKKKSQIGIMGAGLMALATATAPTVSLADSSQDQSQSQSQQSNKRDAVAFKTQAPKPLEQRLNFINAKGGGQADRMLNQRQYRKWMRQCPQLRRSKKCRLK